MNGRGGLPNLAHRWFDNVTFELTFWQSWLLTIGGPWPDNYRDRLDPNTPFDGIVEEVISDTGSREIEILDIGSGPVTSLGYVSKKFDIRITAADPLADAYSALLQNAGVTPRSERKCVSPRTCCDISATVVFTFAIRAMHWTAP